MNNSPGVIIRLQRLPWEAASADVREFFRGLHIPDGGVHIIGGRDGDAFIAFGNDEDARQAMRLDGKRIKNSKVKLLLSSRVEMQQVIDKARMELQQQQQQVNQNPAAGGDGRDRSVRSEKRRRSRSRSRSGDRHHRRSRSRSSDRNRNRGGHGSQQIRNEPAQPPLRTPTTPISGFSSFRNETSDASRYQPVRGVLDRTGPPQPNVDGRFLDRTVGAPPPNAPFYPPRSHEPFPSRGESGPGNSFGPNQANKPYLPSSGNGHRPVSSVNDNFIGASNSIRPGGLMQPPFSQGGPIKLNEPPRFAGSGIRPRMETRFDAPADAGPQTLSPMNLESPFALQQQQPLAAAPPSRASRRALLPAPPEDMPESTQDFGGDHPQRNFDAPVAALFPPLMEMQQRPPQQVLPPRPNMPLDQPMPGEWPLDIPQGFPFNPAPHGRPTLLQPPPPVGPKREIGSCIVMTAVPDSMLRYGAIREFFHPLDLEGADKIKIIVDDNGRRMGQVYCKFLTADDAERALTYTGREKIYIRSCAADEFDNAVDGGLGRPRSKSKERDSDPSLHRSRRDESRSRSSVEYKESANDDFILEVSNIPYKAVQRDLIYRFGQFNPLEIRRLYKHHHVNGKVVTSDTAFVIFGNERDATAAFRAPDRRLFDRDLRVIRSSRIAMDDTFGRAPPTPPEAVAEWIVGPSRDSRDRYTDRDRHPHRSDRPSSTSGTPPLPYQRPVSPYQRPPSFAPKPDVPSEQQAPIVASTPISSFLHTCVCMKGVAMNATNRDVASFFAGLSIAPNGIRILKGAPGVAFVEFVAPTECEQALKKDRSYIGTQMVTVRPCSKEEMMDAVHKQFGLNGGNGGNSPQMQPVATAESTPPMQPSQSQQFFGTSNPAVGSVGLFFNDQPSEMLHHQETEDQTSLLYLQQLAALAKQQDEENAAGGGKLQMDLGQGELTGNNAFSAPELSDMPAIDPAVVYDIGVPGCVAALHNLPPRITLEEICQLFQGYQLIDDSVRMHYSNTGEPTGDCLLAFATARDAQQAVANVNGSMIGGQLIKMYVVPT